MTAKPKRFLSDLPSVELGSPFKEMFEAGNKKAKNMPQHYKLRSIAEYRDYLALAQVSGRIKPCDVTFEGTFRIHFQLLVKHPILTPGGRVETADKADLCLTYPEKALREPLAGTEFIHIFGGNIYHPNVSPPSPDYLVQGVCLGSSILRGVRTRELILMSYALLSLQSIMMDVYDSAGLLNPDAAAYWQANCKQIPLSAEPFVKTN